MRSAPTEVVAASYAVCFLFMAQREAINQAKSYSQKHGPMFLHRPIDARLVDWEEWGRLNALAALDHGMEPKIDPTKVYNGPQHGRSRHLACG